MDYLERNTKAYRAKVDTSTRSGRFIANLIDHGYDTPVDGWDEAKDYNSLPDYYDKDLYKKGQQFFAKYSVAIHYGELMGLISSMLIGFPHLEQTKQWKNNRNSLKRYYLTAVYLMRWYCGDLETDKEVWKAFNNVNRIHRRISKAAPKKQQLIVFTQSSLSVAHACFFLYILTHPKQLGIHAATRDEFTAFVHFWRVVGNLCGIKDEFNVCRDTYEETLEICNFGMRTAIQHMLAEFHPNFYRMAESTVGGVNYIMPLLHVDAILYQLWYDFNDFDAPNAKIQLNWSARLSYMSMRAFAYCYRFTLVRYISNALAMLAVRAMLFVYDRKLIKV